MTNQLRTPWSPELPCPLPEHPRPQMTRPQGRWVNLNGLWEYAVVDKDTTPQTYAGQILVPYAIESLLSGVQRPLLPADRLWYRRTFESPTNISKAGGERVLLHFGAVDYQCELWINGTHVGGHTGGYLPFTFDITSVLIAGANELVVSVWDPSDQGLQQRGKQVLHPKGIWYTAVSGIWQTVWLEVVPTISIESLKLTPNLDSNSLTVGVKLRGTDDPGSHSLLVEALWKGETVASGQGFCGDQLRLEIPHPHTWSPAQPNLYDLQVRLINNDQVLDEVGSYFAMRKFELLHDEDGQLRFALNGEFLFLYGPLDQGYFPDGLYTPPSEEAILYDIEYTKAIGCNLIRKHIKVEPLRWYYHCDRLGMITWQDMPNGGLIDGDKVAFLALSLGLQRNDTRRLNLFGRGEEANRKEFLSELQGMIDHLYNVPSIAAWVPFNESWGQFQASQAAEWVKKYDPTRLVDHASGWFDQGGGDFLSKHVYVVKLKPPKPDPRAFVLSEVGGYSMKVPGHRWDEQRTFGYRFYATSADLTAAYCLLLEEQVKPLISKGLMAVVYTQTTDVEIEINGYLTYDRKVEKMDARVLNRVHKVLITSGSSFPRQ